MSEMESMARRINELNVRNKSQADWIMLLESFVFELRFRIDLDGDAIIYNRLISHGTMDFQTMMTAIENHKARFNISEDTHGK